MSDYLSILTSLFGSGNVFILSMVLIVTIFGAIQGVRGEILKFFLFLFIIGLSFSTTTFVTICAILIFCFYYGKKIYKGVQRP